MKFSLCSTTDQIYSWVKTRLFRNTKSLFLRLIQSAYILIYYSAQLSPRISFKIQFKSHRIRTYKKRSLNHMIHEQSSKRNTYDFKLLKVFSLGGHFIGYKIQHKLATKSLLFYWQVYDIKRSSCMHIMLIKQYQFTSCRFMKQQF